MRIQKRLTLLLCAGIAAIVSARPPQQPDILNARLEMPAIKAGLAKSFNSIVESASSPTWIAYSAPMAKGRHWMCCGACDNEGRTFSRLNGLCHLEGGDSFNVNSNDSDRVKLEGPEHFWIFFRVAQRRVEKIRMFSEGCKLDAAGLPVYWLGDAAPEESVALLSSFVLANAGKDEDENDGGGRHVSREALAAIALTDSQAADQAFDRFTAPSAPEPVRGEAAFWAGEARGQHGLEILQRMVRLDASEHVRGKAVFGLSISKQPGATETLIDVAHHAEISHLRGEALFWLAQKAGKKAVGAITDAIANDPETEVKKKAVFALSQMPSSEGVPLLISVARNNRNPEVRKSAMFWLGQSKDSRALDFIEEILTH